MHASPLQAGAVWRVLLAGGQRTGLLIMNDPDEGWFVCCDMDYMVHMPLPVDVMSCLGDDHAFTTRRDALQSVEGALLSIAL